MFDNPFAGLDAYSPTGRDRIARRLLCSKNTAVMASSELDTGRVGTIDPAGAGGYRNMGRIGACRGLLGAGCNAAMAAETTPSVARQTSASVGTAGAALVGSREAEGPAKGPSEGTGAEPLDIA